jgi:hypothetical protein
MMLMIKTPSAFLHPRRPRVSIWTQIFRTSSYSTESKSTLEAWLNFK